MSSGVFTGGIDESVLHDVAGDSRADEIYKPLVWHKTLNHVTNTALVQFVSLQSQLTADSRCHNDSRTARATSYCIVHIKLTIATLTVLV